MGKKSNKIRGKLSTSKRNELKILSDAILVKSREKITDSNSEYENYVEITRLLDRIMIIENEIKSSIRSTRSEASIEKFISWCKMQGAKLDNIELKYIPEFGLGLIAKKKLSEGNVFIEIPEKMIFSYSKIESSLPEILKQKIFIDCPLFESKNVRLALALMIERLNAQSKFGSYFDVLPNKFNTVLYFTPTDMKELQGTTAISAAIKQVKFIASQYAFLYKYFMIQSTSENDSVLEEFRDNFTYEFYRWAVSCVMTRQNVIPRDNSLNESVLIPAWDMANHTNGTVNTQYNNETQKIESFCMRNFDVGEQVTIAYGNRSNLDFLVHNGFVFNENDNNDFAIRLNLNQNDVLYEKRLSLLNRIGLTDSGHFKILPSYSEELIGFIRVFNMSKEQIDEWLNSDDKHIKNLSSPTYDLGKSFNSKIFQSLLIKIKIFLKLFPTDLDTDLELLKNGTSSKIKSMLIQYRVLERNTLIMLEKDLTNKIKEMN